MFQYGGMSQLVDQSQVRIQGRGAATNPAVRFDQMTTESVDDGWARDEELPVLRTKVSIEVPRRVIIKNSLARFVV